MGTFYEPVERNRWSVDGNGNVWTSKTADEVLSVPIDWTDRLASGETISSSSWEASGVTTSGASLATPVATVKVTGTDGYVINTVVTSAGQTLQRRRDFVAPMGRRSDDYGN
jgi:hypothetical protein